MLSMTSPGVSPLGSSGICRSSNYFGHGGKRAGSGRKPAGEPRTGLFIRKSVHDLWKTTKAGSPATKKLTDTEFCRRLLTQYISSLRLEAESIVENSSKQRLNLEAENIIDQAPHAPVISFAIGEKRSFIDTNGSQTVPLKCTPPFKKDDAIKDSTETSQTQCYSLCSSVAERIGERDDMQDAHCIEDTIDITSLDNNISNVNRLAYYGVFDGHAGGRASQFAETHLKNNILKRIPSDIGPSFDKELKRCLIEAFKQTDEDFLKEASKANPSWKDGSTGLCCLVVNNTLYVANIGDSKAMLIHGNENDASNSSVILLSKDHSPTQYVERMRIQKAGGTVQDGRVLGILEVSRSFGDGRFKRCGVTCIPDVTKRTLNTDDKYIVLACDGFWKGFTVNEAMLEINKLLKVDPGLSLKERLQKTCQTIASDAVRKGSSDNITIIIVAIGNC